MHSHSLRKACMPAACITRSPSIRIYPHIRIYYEDIRMMATTAMMPLLILLMYMMVMGSLLKLKGTSALSLSLSSPSGQYIGMRAAVGPLGMGYAEHIALPVLEQAFSDLKIPDLSFDKDHFKAGVSNIQCEKLSIDTVSLWPQASTGLVVAASGLTLSCKADWTYKLDVWPHEPSGSGSVDISIGGNTHLNGQISITSAGAPTFATTTSLLSCATNVDITNLHFSGGLSGDILNLFKSQIKSFIASEIEKEIGSQLKNLLVAQLNPLLSKEPFSEITAGIHGGALTLDTNFAVGDLSHLPRAPPQLPTPDTSVLGKRHMEVLIDTYPINFALDFVFDMGILDVFVTADMIPASVPVKLNTSTFSSIVPGLPKRYPNLAMQIEINATSRPIVTLAMPGIVTLAIPFDLDFQVLSPIDGHASVFTLTCPLEANASPVVTQNATSGKQVLVVRDIGINCTVALKESSVGDVNINDLNSLIGFLIQSLAIPQIENLLKNGIALPSKFGPIQLTDTTFGVSAQGAMNVISLASNISYNATRIRQSSSVDATSTANEAAEANRGNLRLPALGNFVAALISNPRLRSDSGGTQLALTALRGIIAFARRGNEHLDALTMNILRGADETNPNPRPDFSPPVWSSGGNIINVSAFGALANTYSVYRNNTVAINKALASAKPGDTVLIPAVGNFFCNGGIRATGLVNVTVVLEGTLTAVVDYENWPDGYGKSYYPFLSFDNCTGITITSNGSHINNDRTSRIGSGEAGLIDGQGKEWWNRYTIGTLFGKYTERPKLMVVSNSVNVFVENLELRNSPSWNLVLDGVVHAEVRGVTVRVDKGEIRNAKRSLQSHRRRLQMMKDEGMPGHGKHGRALYSNLQPEDLNTDGIDPSGRDIWIHHSAVYNDDDSIAVKPRNKGDRLATCSQDMLIEDMILTGFGASIGSVPPNKDHNCVKNITFRNIQMPHTGKGIYVKSNPSCGPGKTSELTDILYENIHITDPLWWPIWIGPQQQQEPGSELGRDCSLAYPLDDRCPTQGCSTFTNIILRNVTIDNPVLSPGVILGNVTNPMKGIVMDNVVVNNPGSLPFVKTYECKNANVTALGGTSPVPKCTVG